MVADHDNLKKQMFGYGVYHPNAKWKSQDMHGPENQKDTKDQHCTSGTE